MSFLFSWLQLFLRQWVRRERALVLIATFISLLASACATTGEMGYRPVNTCDASDYPSGFPGCLPASGHFCDASAESDHETDRPDPRYNGQTLSLLPSKESLGAAQPKCPPNVTRLVQEQDEKHARDGAEDVGRQMGVIMARCENLLQQLTHYPDGTLKQWYLDNPASLGHVLTSCANALETVPAIPTFEDFHLAKAAKEGFEKGYEAGVDEVANQLLLIELAVDVIEMIVLPELVLAEAVLTQAIRRSVMALRRMPIFIPGAVGGVGAFVKLAPTAVAKAVVRGSSKALARAMKLARKIRLPGEFAHHIVAHGDDRAAGALKILDTFGVGVDDAVNGVFLPGFKKSPNPHGKAVHGNLHTNRYYKRVETLLEGAKSKADVERVLREIANKLENGLVP